MNSMSIESIFGRVLLTVLVAALGGTAFYLMDLPAAWLSGAMVFVALATLAGAPTLLPDKLRDTLFVLIGLSMGAGVRPDVLERIGEWPVSMALLVVVVVSVTLAGYVVLHFGAKWSRDTAFFGAIPGALNYVIALATERGADLPRIASSQSLRLFVLVAILPFAVVTSNGEPTGEGMSVIVSTPLEILLGLPLCLAASFLAVKLRVPGGWMTGAFFMSGGLNATGLLTVALPEFVVLPCFVMMGAMIGCRFANMTFRQFMSVLGASIAAFCAAFLTSIAGALLLSEMAGIPFGQALLAYAPGGLEVMTLLAFMLDLDPAFVAAHQIVRFTSMVLLLPLITVLVLGRRPT
ncbi:AbrB family transcriptional regulator [Roseibium porphyridii]|uniref:AbrB family transcriptional regulator n=1 Tax=Roseibium porphyridii TaxID=2866279 RepID=A0ABY8EZS9_9HYPH|nr:AbrB family transcriptional regulator [Roseibium sp. KMA01]WFE88687.1 AbrB family transcriptional regulator [Roseibium sp. KMA01]